MSKVTSNTNSQSKGSSKTPTTESAIYNYAIETIASMLPQLNSLDSNARASINSEVEAYKNSGIANINEVYNPMITGLENDIASRFGNLDNSIFSDNLGDIESERADAVSAFAQDVLSKQSNLESDVQDKKYSLVELLSGLINDYYDNSRTLDEITSSKSSKTIATKSTSSPSNSSDVTSLLTSLLNSLI